MPPKAADKKPAASKAPATASKAPEKKDAGKKTAASGDKKKRTKARKETYSSYIYKGELHLSPRSARHYIAPRRVLLFLHFVASTRHGAVGHPTQFSRDNIVSKHRADHACATQSSSRFTPTLVSPTVPCPS